MKCKDGCIQMGKILYNNEEECDDMHELITFDLLKKYKCGQPIIDGDYGHINYALMSYATKHGHLECLKKLHKEFGADWHSDLAQVAAENNQLECLKYIMENMGRVNCGKQILKMDISPECEKYINNICKHCKHNTEHKINKKY